MISNCTSHCMDYTKSGRLRHCQRRCHTSVDVASQTQLCSMSTSQLSTSSGRSWQAPRLIPYRSLVLPDECLAISPHLLSSVPRTPAPFPVLWLLAPLPSPPPALLVATMVAPGFIPALLFAVAIVGALALSRLPVRPYTLSGLVSVGVAAQQTHVYALLTDLSRFPDWFGLVTAATVLPPSEGGGDGQRGEMGSGLKGEGGADTTAATEDASDTPGSAAPQVAAVRKDTPVVHAKDGGAGEGVAPASVLLATGVRFRLTITEAGAVEHHTAEVTAAAPPSRLALRSHGSDADGSGKVIYVFNLAERPVPVTRTDKGGDAAGGPAVETTVHCAFDVEMTCSAAIGALLPLVRGLAQWQLRGYLTKFKALAEADAAATSPTSTVAAECAPAGATPGVPAARGATADGGGTTQPAAAADAVGGDAAGEVDAAPIAAAAAAARADEQPPSGVAAPPAVPTGSD